MNILSKFFTCMNEDKRKQSIHLPSVIKRVECDLSKPVDENPNNLSITINLTLNSN
jgi:hypothetical protein